MINHATGVAERARELVKKLVDQERAVVLVLIHVPWLKDINKISEKCQKSKILTNLGNLAWRKTSPSSSRKTANWLANIAISWART